MITRCAFLGLVIGLLTAPEPGWAQPAKPSATPEPPRRAAPRRKEAAGPAIEGVYRVEGGAAEIRVKRIFGDFYQVASSDGWEGVGILEGAIYRGVFRQRGATPDSTIGEHTIDWSAPESPTVRTTYAAPKPGPMAQRWRRVPEADQRPPEPAPNIVVVPPSVEERPKLGEYVYVEELPEAVTKVAPVYPEGVDGVVGTVLVQALVLKDGTVGDTRVVKSVPMLDEAAVACVRQWRFKPAMAKGAAVAVWVAVPVKFALH
jgi:TonB family protein